MGFASRLLIPGRVSRVATLGVLAGGVALTVWFTINRNVGENTTRMLRDKDGTWRWMTRSDWIQDRLQHAEEQVLENPGDASLQKALDMYRALAQADAAKRLAAAGEMPSDASTSSSASGGGSGGTALGTASPSLTRKDISL